MNKPTHADGMLFMEYYKLWDTPLDGEAWTFLRGLRDAGGLDNYETFTERVPKSSHDWVLFDRVCCSFEQAGVLMKNGLLHPDLYFDGWASASATWSMVETVVKGLQASNPHAYENFEWLARRNDKWLAKKS